MDTSLLQVRLFRNTEGQDLIEYALMAAFIAVGAVAILPSLGGPISTIFSKVTSELVAAYQAS